MESNYEETESQLEFQTLSTFDSEDLIEHWNRFSIEDVRIIINEKGNLEDQR